MKLHLLSDLHLEFGGMEPLPGGDILLLAGDIMVADFLRPERTDKEARHHKQTMQDFFFNETSKYQKVFMVAGNHEHYHGVFDNTHDIIRWFLSPFNVKFLDNESAPLNDEWNVWGGTMWTDFNGGNWFVKRRCQNYMNDYHIIVKNQPNGRVLPLHPEDVVVEHRKSVNALGSELGRYENKNKKYVIMSHHGPTMKSVAGRWGVSEINHAYANQLDNFIVEHPQIRYWVHGHTHDSHAYEIDDCKVFCNPRGYRGHELNPTFNREIVIGEI